MIIESETDNILILKETSYYILFRAIFIFVIALFITLSAKRNTESSSLNLFIAGPLLMAASFVSAIYFFKKIQIIFNKEQELIIRTIKGPINTTSQKSSLTDVVEVEAVPISKVVGLIFQRTEYDINLKYENGDLLKINYSNLGNKESTKIGLGLADFLGVPFLKVKKESVLKTISEIKKLIK